MLKLEIKSFVNQIGGGYSLLFFVNAKLNNSQEFNARNFVP